MVLYVVRVELQSETDMYNFIAEKSGIGEFSFYLRRFHRYVVDELLNSYLHRRV